MVKIDSFVTPPLYFGCSPENNTACELAINQTCYFQKYTDVRQLGWSIHMSQVEASLMFASCILLSLLTIAFWQIKAFQVHPMKIIVHSQMWLCVALWCISTKNISCEWGTYKFLAKSILGYNDSLYHYFRAVFVTFQVKLFI